MLVAPQGRAALKARHREAIVAAARALVDERGAAGFTTDGTTLYWIDSRGRDTAALIAEGEGALTAAGVLVFFFLVAIGSYILHGALKDTTNQFERPSAALHLGMGALILGEIGGFAVLLAGFVSGQFMG